MCKFFFFKQKTAYEMRISDWSSDVCSSYLLNRRIKVVIAHHIKDGRERLFEHRPDLPRHLDQRGLHIETRAFANARAPMHNAARRACRRQRLLHHLERRTVAQRPDEYLALQRISDADVGIRRPPLCATTVDRQRIRLN